MSRLTRRARAGYALGGVATGTYGTVPGLLLMPFLTDEVGVQAALAGFIVFLPKAWDFVLNPVAGRVSDRRRHPAHGRRRMVLVAGLAMALGFATMFAGPLEPAGLAAGWVLVCCLAGASAYAFFQVPFLAMSAEITDDYAERTRLMSWRVIVITLAILLSGGLAPLIVDASGGTAGYRVMGLVMAAVIVVGSVLFFLGTRGTPLTRTEEAGGRMRDQVAVALRSPHARSLLACFFLQAVAMGMVLAGMVYAARTLAGDGTYATYAFMAFVAPAVLVTPLWERLAHRVGKKPGLTAATLVLTTGLVCLVTTRGGGLVPLVAAAAVVGVGYAGGQLFPLAMLPDIAAEDAERTGQNRVGALSGVWSGVELLGYSLGPAAYGLVLAAGGYRSSAGQAVDQTSTATWAVALGISLVPATLVALSLVPLSRYRLDARLRATSTDTSPDTSFAVSR